MSALLKSAGKDIGHEIVGNDGVSSWLHAGAGYVPWLSGEVITHRWEKVIHIVRNPLHVISSAQTLSDQAFVYMFDFLGEHPGGERSLRWYMWSWLKWNELVETQAVARFRVEDLLKDSEALSGFCELAGVAMTPSMPPKTVNARKHTDFTWLDLELADSALCRQVKDKAIAYGYKIVTFGAVMMAKNEAHNLDRCLSSIRPYVDEIIFVDTGSTDDSVSIAEKYGAKIYHHPWQDNFSLHRNQSLSYSTCDWVIQIDCDEELIGDGKELRRYAEALNATDYKAMAIMLRDIHKGRQEMQFNAARIFRRGAVHYEDIVHNRPVFDGDAAMPSGIPTFWLHHYGYDIPKDKKIAKLHRTKALLEKRIAEDKNDIPAYFYLSQVEGELGNNSEVLRLCEIYIENKSKCKRFNRSVYYTHLQVLEQTSGYDDKFLKTLNAYMNELPDDLDITFFALQYAKSVSNCKLLRDSSERFIKIYEAYTQDAHIQQSRFTYTYKPESLATALFYATTMALEYGVKCLSKFAEVLSLTDYDFTKTAAADMQFHCKKIGVSWTHNGGGNNGV
jgi:glycosyltransferase involved in cell wall biosynthesis